MKEGLNVYVNNKRVGILKYDNETGNFSFDYDADWLKSDSRFILNPNLPFNPEEKPALHSAAVKWFFENLLPEGQSLDDVAAINNISKLNLMGILRAIGKETAGAISIGENTQEDHLRPLPLEEISERIRARPYNPFSVWDNKIRMSIAGYQDKIAAFRKDKQWFLTEGPNYASTYILKPEPVREELAGMTSNEFFCMRLAKRIGLDVANVELLHVPEPVLAVERFDRVVESSGVKRLHFIDGCQALGLPVSYKYEHSAGAGKDTKDIRDGASYPKFFELLKGTANPLLQKQTLLRWAIFQVLVGNVDAHAKNISFKSTSAGLSIAPAYDLVSGASFTEKMLDRNYAMAIGDAFTSEELDPYEWANFADACGFNFSHVSKVLEHDAKHILETIDDVMCEVVKEGADRVHVGQIVKFVKKEALRHLDIGNEVKKVSRKLFI